MSIDNNQEPCLVQAGQGSCYFTVQYKNRFLYSKYNPLKAVETLAENLKVLPGTLVIAFSPVLWYGAGKLLERLPEDCHVIFIEADPVLLDFAWKNLPADIGRNLGLGLTPEAGGSMAQGNKCRGEFSKAGFCENKFCRADLGGADFFSLADTMAIEDRIYGLLRTGKIKRALRFDMSAIQLSSRDTYTQAFDAIADIIQTFWKNRITLVKMGKLFCRNMMKNLSSAMNSDSGTPVFLEDVGKTVATQILVCGAGEGLEEFILTVRKAIDSDCGCRKYLYIIAVDAALVPLLRMGIVPDALVAVESQLAIEKVYIGSKSLLAGNRITVFADLVSRPEVIEKLAMDTVWFASRFARLDFFCRLQSEGIITSLMEPMGSVGLYAVYIALALRSSEDVPVFTYGLDFSFSLGKTHANGTSAHKDRLRLSGRFSGIDSIASSFGPSSIPCTGKNGKAIYSLKNLESYARQFFLLFSREKNLFDASDSGIDLGIPLGKPDLSVAAKVTGGRQVLQEKWNPSRDSKEFSRPKKFMEDEKAALVALRDLLSKGENSSHRMNGITLDEQIQSLLQGREYLFVHFPDGCGLKMSLDFLKRVRAEIDFFLKVMG